MAKREPACYQEVRTMPDVKVYCSRFCGYCTRAKLLLEKKGVEYEEVSVDMNPGKRQEMVKLAGGRTSVPQIFIGEHHVGGCDDLYALENEGKLDTLLGLVHDN